MNNDLENALELSNSLSERQRQLILLIANECKLLGATSHQLAPIFAAVLLSNREPTTEDIEWAEAVIERHKKSL